MTKSSLQELRASPLEKGPAAFPRPRSLHSSTKHVVDRWSPQESPALKVCGSQVWGGGTVGQVGMQGQ
jgi:hypothetical protein